MIGLLPEGVDHIFCAKMVQLSFNICRNGTQRGLNMSFRQLYGVGISFDIRFIGLQKKC